MKLHQFCALQHKNLVQTKVLAEGISMGTVGICFTSESGPSGGSWGPGLQLGLQQGTDVVGKGPAVLLGGTCRFVWLLADTVVVATHPFLAAAALRPGQQGPRATPVGQGHLLRTKGHAANHSIHAGALVLAAGLEVLAVLVDLPTKLTR